MTDIDVAALRAAAESATLPMTCGGHRSMGSLVRCEECKSRADARADLSVAANPAVVLDLLDRLAAAEGAVARVRITCDTHAAMRAKNADVRLGADVVVAQVRAAIKEQP